ncbi:MAG: hypothetical protein F2903_07585 [Actinobacteria bacterium]|uniref:Unannotated protein n=1 Tax=freshwater metagenome TaxID=449393 RepID=A0A6J7E2N1_9ZZZZ|nr:hypothetical protein [Actinomycetota bacterium]MSX10206.1 hypothetical protein [Actinomycetota bacterium]MSX69002.1 hypothetical protein [Actinomycetota bacterium]
MPHSSHHHNPATEHHLSINGPSWLPMALALVLGISALVSGVTAWRVAIHSGHAQLGFAVSTQSVNNANAVSQNVTRAVGSERALFISWDQAVLAGNTELANSILSMMEPDTQAAVHWWNDEAINNRPPTPFASANPKWTTPGQIIEAAAISEEATNKLDESNAQLNQAHNLELLGALLAIALLTGGLTATLKSTQAQLTLLGVSCTSLGVATIGLVILW